MAHMALPNVTGVCDTCHNGAGSGTSNHDNGVVNVNVPGAYNAKSGTAVKNADGTCSSVSCHGGNTTPVWWSGKIDVATQCTACHSYGSDEYNGFYSGQHGFHAVTATIPCSSCHDATKLAAKHFSALDTPAFEGPASATIGSSQITSYSKGSCTAVCHGDPNTPRSWW